jgi:hypothetical protein
MTPTFKLQELSAKEEAAAVLAQCSHTKYEGCQPCAHDIRHRQILIESAAQAAYPFLVHLPEGAELVVYDNGGWSIEVGAPEGDALAIAPADTDYLNVEAVIATLNDTVDDDYAGVAGG